MTRLFAPIGTLRGVGAKRSAVYESLGIRTPHDLLYYLPRTYRDYRDPQPAAEVPADLPAVIRVTILEKKRPVHARGGLTIFTLEAEDAQGTPVTVRIFNNVYSFRALEVGKTYSMYGKVSGPSAHREIASPLIHRESDAAIEAVYPQTTGLTSAMVRTNIRDALQMMDEAPFETLPADLRRRYGLCTLPHALHGIHVPAAMEEAQEARHRLAFEEMLRLWLGLRLLRQRAGGQSAYPVPESADLSGYFGSLPFPLTGAQKRAVGEIRQDLVSGRPMNRLLQGDVGSGKTAVAAAACVLCVQGGFQCALMAPTEILAGQHYATLSGFLTPLGIRVVLLTGSMKQKEKRLCMEQIADGSAQVIVGTHAIFQKAVTYDRLGLVITDEQHRFGVAQRTALAEKGGVPHKLVMSATPIPRTLALMVYGDLDVSVLDELPAGRLPVETYAVTGKLRERAVGFMIRELGAGRQAYIVCPAIEDGGSDLRSVTKYAQEIGAGSLKDWRIGILHGQMTPAEKETAMEKFRAHETDVLVCTTVVEVGVDVPNATVMLVEDAERFGLSQLHQLRGRVGRSSHQSYCILVTEHANEESRRRLRLLSSTTDGFAVAQADLELRGPGDFFGSMQHGLPPLKLGSLADTRMLHDVQEAGEALLAQDPDLREETHHALYMDIVRLFAQYGDNGLN